LGAPLVRYSILQPQGPKVLRLRYRLVQQAPMFCTAWQAFHERLIALKDPVTQGTVSDQSVVVPLQGHPLRRPPRRTLPVRLVVHRRVNQQCLPISRQAITCEESPCEAKRFIT
jgi:hypothetical protein